MNVSVNRLPHRIEPDPRRTIACFFNAGGDPRARAIIGRVGRLPDSEASALLEASRGGSSGRSIGISVRFFSSITKRSVNSFLQRLR